MTRKFSESEVDKIQDTLTSIVDSFIRNGYSPESVAEGFIREGYCVRDAIDEKSKRSKHHGRDSGYSSSYPSYGHDSGYSSHDSSHKGPRGYRAHEYRPGGDSGHYEDYAHGAYKSSHTGSRGYRAHEYRPGGDSGHYQDYSHGAYNSSHTGSRGYRAHEYRPGGDSGHYQDYSHGAYNSSHTGSRGYRAHEHRPGGYDNSSYTAPPPPGTKPKEDLYKVLCISKAATAEQIKSAHRKLCMKYHPDRVKGTHEKKAATEHMAQINQANDVLKDEKLRAYYDRTGYISPNF